MVVDIWIWNLGKEPPLERKMRNYIQLVSVATGMDATVQIEHVED